MYGQNKEYTLKGHLEERTSKTGKPYEVLIIKFGSYEKVVFLQSAEMELLKQNCK